MDDVAYPLCVTTAGRPIGVALAAARRRPGQWTARHRPLESPSSFPLPTSPIAAGATTLRRKDEQQTMTTTDRPRPADEDQDVPEAPIFADLLQEHGDVLADAREAAQEVQQETEEAFGFSSLHTDDRQDNAGEDIAPVCD